jgi:hypothetical protein
MGKDAAMPLFGKRNREKQAAISDYEALRINNMVMESWIKLAAYAWKGYEASGRGFILLDFSDDTSRYIPAAMPTFSESQESAWRDTQRNVKAYDPKTEIVLVLNQFSDDSMTTLYQSTPDGMPTPPEAYKEMHGEN